MGKSIESGLVKPVCRIPGLSDRAGRNPESPGENDLRYPGPPPIAAKGPLQQQCAPLAERVHVLRRADDSRANLRQVARALRV